MCKNLLVVGASLDKKLVDSLCKAILPEMVRNDPHGVGITTVGDNGVHIERWLHVRDALKKRDTLTPDDVRIKERYAMIDIPHVYNSSGTPNNNVTALMMHSRYATTPKTLENVHPFVSGDTLLQHNGIVEEGGLEYFTSTCDSEGILNAYVEHDVQNTTDNIQLVADRLQGYYACIALSGIGTDAPVIDVFKDARSRLFVTYVKKLGAYVFVTEPYILNAALRKLKMKAGKYYVVPYGCLIRHNAFTGGVIGTYRFRASPKVNHGSMHLDAPYSSKVSYSSTDDTYAITRDTAIEQARV